MGENRPASIPNFVRGRSPQGLRRAMLTNNARLGSFVHYFNIQFVALQKDAYWVAWFFEPIQNNDPIFNVQDGE